MWDYPTFLWVPEPATIYRDVRALRPGEGLEVSARGVHEFSFKEHIPRSTQPVATDEDAIAVTRATVREAVRSRLLADVPLGAFLSSGLDSSIVCSLAREQLAELSTFCIGFEDVDDPYHGRSDESAAAAQYAETLGTRHTTVRVSGRDFRESAAAVHRGRGPALRRIVGARYPRVARQARAQGIKVLLSGDGADEAFGGYSWYPSIADGFAFAPRSRATARFCRFLDRDGTRDATSRSAWRATRRDCERGRGTTTPARRKRRPCSMPTCAPRTHCTVSTVRLSTSRSTTFGTIGPSTFTTRCCRR